jgi:DNA-binding transcriptional ArsR family regulator
MSYPHSKTRLQSSEPLASVPPVMIEETGWDIVLALRSDRRSELSLARLASIVSIPQRVLEQWLARLEERKLITGAAHRWTGELLAILTPTGRALLDRYLAATSDLRIGALN